MIRRSPNLTPDRVDIVIEIIRRWDGRLTWPALIKVVTKRLHATYTRQALYKHERIRIAYETYRARLSDARGGRPLPAALNACLERTKRLQQENAELRKREALLLEQFVRWAYNAASRGLTVEFLNRALPPTNRTGNATSGRRFQ
ncbi:hypothetical protein SAMN05192544_103822 [Paraburkholderia hospita]|jgi:hypothetical protein|uniref:Uncharacterized protein n=1 Tax=Paraburkholderia dipogonis TaxID=1211383 RepID=A0ABW9AWW9_9BURK|nr:hypothetical protein SAMN05192544_103822 [Paraburkholderia hospita]